MLTINKTMEDGVLTMEVIGRLNTQGAQELEKELADSIAPADELILDFQGVSYIASSALRVLFITNGKMAKRSGMKIIHVPEIVMDVFEITNFSDVLTIE